MTAAWELYTHIYYIYTYNIYSVGRCSYYRTFLCALPLRMNEPRHVLVWDELLLDAAETQKRISRWASYSLFI